MADGGKVIIKIDGDESGFKGAMGGLGKVAKTAFKGIAIGAGAAAAAIGTIGTAAIKSYAEYEQLVGGVETLFKDSADVVKKYADQAYKAAGMSANEYMSTVTSFSASLLQSLGGDTAKAAEYGNQAVIDMSDNANKMGTSIEMIQNAYQGFAKQNYTMLDNLKLGYGGTKEEMQRLLEDAEKISGIKYDISSFADITQAIHVIQTNLGITGTTALEASSTIQGSASAMKASWQNLLTGMADPTQNFEQLLQNFISSVGTFLGNLLPILTTATQGVLKMVQGLLPQIPALIEQVLPIVIEGVSGIITGLAEVLPQIVNTVVGVLPQIIDAILNLLPMILDAGLQIILSLAQGIIDALPNLIPKVVDIILQITKTLLDNLDQIVFAAIDIIVALAMGLIDAIPELLEELPAIITSIVMFLTDPSMTFKLVEAAILLMAALIEGLIKSIPAILEGIAKIIPAMINGFKSSFQNFKDIGKHLIDGLWQGIINTKDWLLNKIKSFTKTITQGIKDFFGIKSPSRVFRDEVGLMLAKGLAIGIKKGTTEVEKVMNSMNETLLESEQKYIDESERLKNSKTEADKKYLEELKETAEKERKLYDARLKDIENWKNAVTDTINELVDNSFNKIEEVEQMQKSFADKLKDFGKLYKTVVFPGADGQEQTLYRLSDLSKQTDALKDYSEALQAVKARGNVPTEFFAVLRALSIEEGTMFAQELLRVDDASFNQYIKDWTEKQRVAEDVSKMLYADESASAQKEIIQSFEEFNNELENQGEKNADAWGEGFYSKIKEKMPEIFARTQEALFQLFPTSGFAYAGGVTTNNYNAVYNVQPSGTSTTEQLAAIRDAETLERMRGTK